MMKDVISPSAAPCGSLGNLDHFYSICVAAVARQLDSRNLNEVLFRNGSGLLYGTDLPL
jgi:hypothetical protein